jgi:hypothetical protein
MFADVFLHREEHSLTATASAFLSGSSSFCISVEVHCLVFVFEAEFNADSRDLRSISIDWNRSEQRARQSASHHQVTRADHLIRNVPSTICEETRQRHEGQRSGQTRFLQSDALYLAAATLADGNDARHCSNVANFVLRQRQRGPGKV